MRVDESVEIRADAGAAFSLVADPERDPEWRSGVRDVTLITGEAGRRGARYRETVVAAGRAIDVEFEIAAVTPGERIGFRLSAPVAGEAAFAVAPSGSGCRVTFGLRLARGSGLRALADRAVGATVARSARGDLARLRDLLEARGPGPPPGA